MIYTVHTLRGPDCFDGRTPGYFNTYECVIGNYGDIHETTYRYAVIEEFDEGLYNIPKLEKWFRWTGNNDSGKYVECKKPDSLKRTVCFGIG